MQQAMLELFANAFSTIVARASSVSAAVQDDHFVFELCEPKKGLPPQLKTGPPTTDESGRGHYGLDFIACALSSKTTRANWKHAMFGNSCLHTAISFRCLRVRLNPLAPTCSKHDADHRRILIVDDERPILMTLEAFSTGMVTRPTPLHRHPWLEIASEQFTRGRFTRLHARRRRLANARPDQTRHPETQVIILTAHDS